MRRSVHSEDLSDPDATALDIAAENAIATDAVVAATAVHVVVRDDSVVVAAGYTGSDAADGGSADAAPVAAAAELAAVVAVQLDAAPAVAD